MKSLGAKKVAGLGYGTSPSSSAFAEATTKYAAPAVGLEDVYTNTTVDFGSTDVGPLVLGIKNARADAGFWLLQPGDREATAGVARVDTPVGHAGVVGVFLEVCLELLGGLVFASTGSSG
jgi:hypothetical protein